MQVSVSSFPKAPLSVHLDSKTHNLGVFVLNQGQQCVQQATKLKVSEKNNSSQIIKCKLACLVALRLTDSLPSNHLTL